MKHSTIGIGILIFGILGAGYLGYSYFGRHAGAASVSNPGVPTGSGAVSGGGLAQSSDKVSFSLNRATDSSHTDSSRSGAMTLAVKLQIDKGWHVNAHPASIQGLLATSVTGTAAGRTLALNPAYPPGLDSGIRLNGTAIKVYDNGTIIMLKPGGQSVDGIRDAGGLDVQLRVQSCSDDGICLAPSTLSKHLNIR